MESRLQDAMQFYSLHPQLPLSSVARKYNVPRTTLQRRLAGAGPRKGREATHKRLLKAEEAAICRYIDHLERMSLAVRKDFITQAANNLLKARSKDGQYMPLGVSWTRRFLVRHSCRGPASLDGTTAAVDGDALPPGPGEWEDALGLPLCVVCQNVCCAVPSVLVD